MMRHAAFTLILSCYLGIAAQSFLISASLISPSLISMAHAVTPEEMLADPELEKRARDLSKQLRCLVCQNQSIDDSDAELARDLRIEVRRQISDGASDTEIISNLRTTYGDYVLLNPPVSPATYILWSAPVVILLSGIWLVVMARRRQADAQHAVSPVQEAQSPKQSFPRMAGIALLALALAASLSLYLLLGRADLPDRPLAQRTAEIAAIQSASNAADTDRLTALEAALQKTRSNSDDIGAWLELGLAAAATGRNELEVEALQTALALADGEPAIAGMLAEAMARAADGQVTVPARQLIEATLARNPDEPRALFLAGLAAYQDEDFARAVTIWQQLQAVSLPDAPWMPLLARNIADAAAAGGIVLPDADPADRMIAGPTDDDIAAAADMSDAERKAMIEGMVEGLAARLADDPADAAGWQRLAQAYQVMGRNADARTALIGAADAQPESATAQLDALQAIVVAKAESDHAVAAARLLSRLVAVAPDRPETLYLQGYFAASNGDTDAARQFWQALLDRVPEDAPIRDQLQAAIDGL